jgi:serine protease Do
LGSGFIISKDGYILTNNHVVENASQIIVRFSDRSELEAKLIGADPRSDLALLKVESQVDLPTLKIGRSENLKVGEWVLAIGSPFGFDYSVTAGIVSAKGRSLPTEKNENYVPYIQTDVAINPGNSGGPLFNLKGEVVGINAQIYSNSGGFMGVSFAIPIDVAIEVSDQLKVDGRVSRGWLGVMIQEINKDLAESFGLERPQGALVAKVVEGSPASKDGILEGDVIIQFNDKSIERSSELPHFVGRVRPGEDARLTIMRGGKEMSLNITIEELPEAGQRKVLVDNKAKTDRLGLVVQELTSEQLNRLGIKEGVVVVEVKANAIQSGIREGDVITRLNNLPVKTPDSLDKIATNLTQGRTYPILVIRNQTPVFLALRVPD